DPVEPITYTLPEFVSTATSQPMSVPVPPNKTDWMLLIPSESKLSLVRKASELTAPGALSPRCSPGTSAMRVGAVTSKSTRSVKFTFVVFVFWRPRVQVAGGKMEGVLAGDSVKVELAAP